MRRTSVVGVLGALGCLVAGCGFGKDMQSAQAVADEYLTAVANQDIDKAMSLWDPRGFPPSFTEKEWRTVLASLPKKLGKMEERKIVHWKAVKGRIAGMTGTFCELRYEVSYAKYPAQEIVTLFRPARGDRFLVVGHKIYSKGMVLS